MISSLICEPKIACELSMHSLVPATNASLSYEDNNDASKSGPGPAQAAPQPPPAAKPDPEPQVPQLHAAPLDSGVDSMMKHEDDDDDDDDVDFNLGGGSGHMTQSGPADESHSPPPYGTVHKASAKEDG
jgi:RNA-binding protein Musashi